MTDRMEAAMPVEAPERIWIESDGESPYFYHEEELADVAPPITEYVRADKLEELAAEIEALRESLAALKIENEKLREALKGMEKWASSIHDGYPPSTASIAAAPYREAARAAVLTDREGRQQDKLDAARYRWLREGNDAKHGAAWHIAVNLYGCEWDAAIDAAMSKEGRGDD